VTYREWFEQELFYTCSWTGFCPRLSYSSARKKGKKRPMHERGISSVNLVLTSHRKNLLSYTCIKAGPIFALTALTAV